MPPFPGDTGIAPILGAPMAYDRKSESGAAVRYEEVERVAISIMAEGRHPSLSAIREGLGDRGSYSTLTRHKRLFIQRLAARLSESPPLGLAVTCPACGRAIYLADENGAASQESS